MLVGTPGFQQTRIKKWEILVGTPGFQQKRIKDMVNGGRHTRISADKDKKWEMMEGTSGSWHLSQFSLPLSQTSD